VTTEPISRTVSAQGQARGQVTLTPESGRVLPHDIQAEQSVLGALLLDQDAFSAIRDVLETTDFYSERHAHIYRAAAELSDRGEPIDLLTLRSQLERNGTLVKSGGIEYLAELSVVTPTASSVRHYAEIVIQHALRRQMITTGSSNRRNGL